MRKSINHAIIIAEYALRQERNNGNECTYENIQLKLCLIHSFVFCSAIIHFKSSRFSRVLEAAPFFSTLDTANSVLETGANCVNVTFAAAVGSTALISTICYTSGLSINFQRFS